MSLRDARRRSRTSSCACACAARLSAAQNHRLCWPQPRFATARIIAAGRVILSRAQTRPPFMTPCISVQEPAYRNDISRCVTKHCNKACGSRRLGANSTWLCNLQGECRDRQRTLVRHFPRLRQVARHSAVQTYTKVGRVAPPRIEHGTTVRSLRLAGGALLGPRIPA